MLLPESVETAARFVVFSSCGSCTGNNIAARATCGVLHVQPARVARATDFGCGCCSCNPLGLHVQGIFGCGCCTCRVACAVGLHVQLVARTDLRTFLLALEILLYIVRHTHSKNGSFKRIPQSEQRSKKSSRRNLQ